MAVILVYYLRDLLLSSEKISAIAGPQEGYYWTAAQYQLAFLRFEGQVVLYAKTRDTNIEEVKFRYAILQSKFRILSYPAELIHFFKKVPEYDTALKSLQQMMSRLNNDVAALEYDRTKSEVIVARLKTGWPAVATIANNTRKTEIRQKEMAFSDFYRKRQIIYIGSLVLLSLFVIVILFLLLTFRRHKKVIQQHRIALDAEQRAVSAARNIIEEKNRFLAIVNHELRSPLQSIIAAVDLFLDETPHKNHAKVKERLSSALCQLEVQMRDLTDYVRLESGHLELRKSKITIGEVINRAINDVQPLAQKKGLPLHLECHIEDVTYIIDSERITQILNNLLINAIKYTMRGRVDVRATIAPLPDHDLLTIEIADTGIGISADKIATIFEPFTQAYRSNTHRSSGMGMGLSIVKRLVHLLDGDVTVNSSSNDGTIFHVILPLKRDLN